MPCENAVSPTTETAVKLHPNWQSGLNPALARWRLLEALPLRALRGF
jgi:hypothetical protein